MNIHGPNLNFQFDQSEYIALCELARKLGTDLASVLRMGGLLLLEADKRGLMHTVMSRPAELFKPD